MLSIVLLFNLTIFELSLFPGMETRRKKKLPAKKVDDHVSDPPELAPLLDYSGYENHRPLDRVKDGPWVKVIKLLLFVTDK